MANSAKTAKKSPKTKKWSKMKKIFLRKSAIFQPFPSYRADWEPATTSGKCMAGVPGVFWRSPAVFWGPSTHNPPNFHMHIGKIGQFFKIRVFHEI